MKSCLLVIDLQTGLLAEKPLADDADAVIGRINSLADRARSEGVPVIYVHHEESGLEFGSASWQLDPRVQSRNGDLSIRKTTVDAFYETGLQQLLAKHAITHLTICGYATEFCVDTTSRRAATLGFPVTLVSDAHTTQDRPYLSAQLIRRHHTDTLVNLSGFPARITAEVAEKLWPNRTK
ncbi:MAG: cysteine hydrolase family protein [Opitutus sp.]